MKRGYKFGDNQTYAVGTIINKLSVPTFLVLEIKADVVNVDVPFLKGLGVLSELRAILDAGREEVRLLQSRWEFPRVRKLGPLYVECSSSILFTVGELWRIYRHFFHAHPEKVIEVLGRTDPDGTSGDDLKRLEKIHCECDVCKRIVDAHVDSTCH